MKQENIEINLLFIIGIFLIIYSAYEFIVEKELIWIVFMALPIYFVKTAIDMKEHERIEKELEAIK